MGPCGPEGPVGPCGPGGPCSPSVPLCPGRPSLPGSPGMIGSVAALARQVLDLAASVVRYTAVKNVRDTRSLTVRGSIFGDNSKTLPKSVPTPSVYVDRTQLRTATVSPLVCNLL